MAFSEADPLANSKLLWPHQEALPGYEAAMREYFMAMWHLNRRLNHLMAVALKVGLVYACMVPACLPAGSTAALLLACCLSHAL